MRSWQIKIFRDSKRTHLNFKIKPILGNQKKPIPQKKKIFCTMLSYLRQFRTYNKEEVHNHRVFVQQKVPQHIIPIEQICHLCKTQLSNPITVTNNAKVVTLQGVFHNFKSFRNVFNVVTSIDIKNQTTEYIIMMIAFSLVLIYVSIFSNIYNTIVQLLHLSTHTILCSTRNFRTTK